MKKIFTSVAAIALTVALGATAMAQGGGGCTDCRKGAQHGMKMSQQTDAFKKFQADTIDLRQEMMNKRFELQRENLKGSQNVAKIDEIKAEITALQKKISDIRVQSGLSDTGKRDGECFNMNGGCNTPGVMGECNGPCGQKM